MTNGTLSGPPMGSTGFRVVEIGEPRPIQKLEEIQEIHEDHEERTIQMLEDRVLEVPVETVIEKIVEVGVGLICPSHDISHRRT